jgi:hypothetical protein
MNTNYEKDFVPYEEALALKELGFDEPTYTWRQHGNGISGDVEGKRDYYNRKGDVYTALPLYQQAFRWFREKYNIDAWVQPFVSEKHGKPFLPDESYAYYIFEDGVYVADGVNFLDSEEAELECLKKLIEIVKQ